MTGVELPFDLGEVKLATPSSRPGTVAKTDLIGELCGSDARFVTVIAPAGYGKTTVLAKWAEADPRPFAWVALDGRDDDPVVFLRYIAAAIHRVEPLPPKVLEAISGPGGSAWEKRVPGVGSALGSLGRPVVLVLDDLHGVSNRVCLDVLAELFEYVPAGSQIAVASREDPALPLARWRSMGLVHEIGVPDLRMDELEAETLLAAAGAELDAGELSELTKRTEGWPAGLYLAALSLQAGATSVASFTGEDRFLAEYFRLELLSRLSAAEARFLKYTSVLDRMCGGLCDSVLESSGSAPTLEALERTNCFVVPLDREGEWYRYHHLFAELLRKELERTEPDMVRELNRRAMTWCIGNEMAEPAVFYGHAAGETDAVADLVDSLALPVHYDGRMATLDEWLGCFNDSELERYPALAVVGAWVRVLTGRTVEAERWLAIARAATSTIPPSDGSATYEPWIATLRAGMMQGGVDQALDDADRAMSQLSAESRWRPAALVLRGIAHALLGAADSAIDDLTRGIEAGLATDAAEVVILAEAQLALLAAGQGAWAEAGRHSSAAEAAIEDMGMGDYVTSALGHVAVARVALHEAKPGDARAAVARAHRLRPQLDHGLPWLTIQVGLELGRAHLALAEPVPARTILIETERVLELRPDMGVLVKDARELRDRVAATSGSDGAWAMSLTEAELRLLPYLATHLMFPEIASRLFISRNTVKSEAISIYRKLGVSSRSEAIERAVEFGLLENFVYPGIANLMPEG